MCGVLFLIMRYSRYAIIMQLSHLMRIMVIDVLLHLYGEHKSERRCRPTDLFPAAKTFSNASCARAEDQVLFYNP